MCLSLEVTYVTSAHISLARTSPLALTQRCKDIGKERTWMLVSTCNLSQIQNQLKLNSGAEMIGVTYPNENGLGPFVGVPEEGRMYWREYSF